MDEADKGTMRGVRRSLVGQSVGIAAVCLICDAVDFAFLGPGLLHTHLGVLRLIVIILVDSALALPARFSGWVALAHGLSGFLLLGGNYAGRLIAGYRAGAWLRGWSAPASLVALAGGVVLSRMWIVHQSWLGVCLQVGSSAILPWLVGRYTTARRAYIDEMRHRREVQARHAAAEVDKAVARERTAIARDLHDVISHHVSAIGVHAGAARMKLNGAQTGSGVTDSLAAVEAASRSAMVDLRTMLDLLHGAADTASQPGLDNLEELLQNVRRSGLATKLTVLGVPRAVPGSLDIALYRITQEMLTNALRHGDGTLVEVEITYLDSSIALAARNGIGAGAEVSGTGRGLAGIRTRVAMFAGTVRHGPSEDNRCWETMVTVPIEGAS
ncbi:MAG TPA: histidine kinase [Pseudonocardiaceae bacterium]|nr:histidine kinase [Pseudonocardiaceae bacterium]